MPSAPPYQQQQSQTQSEDIKQNYAPIVQLTSGKVRGRILEVGDDDDGKSKLLHFYEGIPFGKLNLGTFLCIIK